MVRNRVRTSQRTTCSESTINEARERIAKGESKRQVAESLGMPESTLRLRLQRGYTSNSLGRFKPTFSLQMETEFSSYIKTVDNMFYGITVRELRCLAFQFAEKNKINHRFDKNKQMAGKDWVYEFLKRNKDLSLRQPTATGIGRAMGFNKVQVEKYFNNLEELFIKFKFSPAQIYNMDETGVNTVPPKIPKVISTKGKSSVNKVVSGERGVTVTVVCCMSASGHFIPPAFIFPRKRMNDEFLTGAPPSSIAMLSDSGFINCDLFINWLHHFQSHVRSCKENPCLLILDNHASHITLSGIEFCRENHIHLLSLPPHSSHKAQPLDRSFFGPLKRFYSSECDNWMVTYKKSIAIKHVSRIFYKAYTKAATISNAVKGFEVTGIHPFDKDIFTELDFLPSRVTDIPVNAENAEAASGSSGSFEVCAVPGPSSGNTDAFITDNCSTFDESETNPRTTRYVTVQEISPLPKAEYKQKRRRAGKKSEIITSSPFKRRLEMQLADRTSKISKKKKPTALNFVEGVKKKGMCSKTGSPKKDFYCPGCNGKYVDPPDEEWIMCELCKCWWHEECTGYEGGIFKCDMC